MSDLHTKLRIIGRGVPGLATDSPCGLWGLGWTSYLLRGGPLLGLGFKWELMCKFAYSDEQLFIYILPLLMFLYIIQVLPIIFLANEFSLK